VAERRVCSVLFCDLVGFTPLSESRDAEEVRELLSRYFETARTVIGRYGGVVEKFIGDAVMAVWGTPVAVEGDTERAVRAALDLVAAVATLGSEIHAPTLAARAGVVTGEVAVTVGATNEGMVAGDAVNTAARVQSVASAGSVFVDATTRRLAQAGVEFAAVGEFELKGKAEPQHLWRAGRVLSNVGGAQRVDGLEAPLTGRDTELRLIKELFHASVDRRQLRLVAIAGPAGVGKSRLGWEFEKYIDGLADTVWWHRGRCLSYGDGVSFWALAEIVRQRLDISEEDDADVAAGKLTDGLDRYLPAAGERDYVGARLARLLGVPFAGDPAQDFSREELFAGWRLWFERLAQSSPVVLLIEDVHYADAGVLDFVDHLLDWGRDVPIFVLTFGRPEMRVERTWGSGRNRTQLALDALDAASMEALLDSLVPGLPQEAASAIAEQAQGIPLFAVETIRALIDRDIVIPSEGVYKLVGELGTLRVPDSLHGLLAARLDALSPAARSLVADASVLGSSFPAEALSAVSGHGLEQVRDVLDDLVRRGVLEIVADPLSPQRGTYRFGHDMLRQVSYDTLSRHDRKTRHLAVAEHLRATFANDGEEVVDVIARHFLDALAAVPDADDVESTRARAVDELVRAGERASRVGASRSSAKNFADAADLLTATSAAGASVRAAKLWERATHASHRDGDWLRGLDTATRAHDAYEALGDARGVARANSLVGSMLRSLGRHAEARERLNSALAVLRVDPDEDTAFALNQLAALEVMAGTADAERTSAEATGMAQLLGVSPALLSGVFNNRAIALQSADRRVEAVMYLREAARLGEAAEDSFRQGFALANAADALCPDDPFGAVDLAREAAALSRRAGGVTALALSTQVLAAALLETGQWDEAAAVVAQAIEQDGIGHHELVAYIDARLAASRGDTTAADTLREVAGFWRTSEDPQDRASLALVEALVALAEQRPDMALAKAKDALSHVDVIGFGAEFSRWSWSIAARAAHDLRDDGEVTDLLALFDGVQRGRLPRMVQAEVSLARARRAGLAGDANADDQFTEALADLRKRSTPYHLAHGLLDYADYLIGTGERGAADALITEAREIGERLGAGPLVHRAEAMSTAREVVT
jgi:class 3 adenylate cyclase/predicted ATPase